MLASWVMCTPEPTFASVAPKVINTLTRCCISAVSCLQAGMCACDGNRDSHLFSDRLPGEGRGLGDIHNPPHTPPCTGPVLWQAQGAAQMHSWGDRRTHSPKIPDPWGRHGLGSEPYRKDTMEGKSRTRCYHKEGGKERGRERLWQESTGFAYFNYKF